MSSSKHARNLRSNTSSDTTIDMQPEDTLSSTSIDQSQTTISPGNWVKYFDSKFGTIETTMRENDIKLSERISNLEQSVTKSVDFAIATAKEALAISNDSRKIINELKLEIEQLKKSMLKSHKIQEKFDESLVKQELFSRKRNLIFTSFDNIDYECSIVVMKVFEIMHLSHIKCETAHFLHDKKQFIVRFASITDRDSVWNARRHLGGSRFFVSEDLPAKIKQQHDELFIVAKAARSSSKYDKVYLQANKLTIDGVTYTGNSIKNLPNDINPCYLSQRTSDSVVCFGGKLSKYHPLSNFYDTSFVYKNIKYNSSEQALQHIKSLKFNDNTKAQHILNTSDCAEQKKLGRNVANFNQTAWNSVKIDMLTDILKAKFSQNREAKQYLSDTKARVIGEASVRDDVYGIGFPIHHTDVLNKERWNGSNELGNTLMTVREYFKNI